MWTRRHASWWRTSWPTIKACPMRRTTETASNWTRSPQLPRASQAVANSSSLACHQWARSILLTRLWPFGGFSTAASQEIENFHISRPMGLLPFLHYGEGFHCINDQNTNPVLSQTRSVLPQLFLSQNLYNSTILLMNLCLMGLNLKKSKKPTPFSLSKYSCPICISWHLSHFQSHLQFFRLL